MNNSAKTIEELTELIFDGNNRLRRKGDGKRKFGEKVDARPIGPPVTVNCYSFRVDEYDQPDVPMRADAYVIGNTAEGPQRGRNHLHSISIQFYRIK